VRRGKQDYHYSDTQYWSHWRPDPEGSDYDRDIVCEAPAHHQNSSFNPYCMMRGFTLMELIFPKVLGLDTLLAGFAKFG
jgi:hypothetical protein